MEGHYYEAGLTPSRVWVTFRVALQSFADLGGGFASATFSYSFEYAFLIFYFFPGSLEDPLTLHIYLLCGRTFDDIHISSSYLCGLVGTQE